MAWPPTQVPVGVVDDNTDQDDIHMEFHNKTNVTLADLVGQVIILTNALGQPSGIATLDSSGKLVPAVLPPGLVFMTVASGVTYLHTTPTINTGAPTTGDLRFLV